MKTAKDVYDFLYGAIAPPSDADIPENIVNLITAAFAGGVMAMARTFTLGMEKGDALLTQRLAKEMWEVAFDEIKKIRDKWGLPPIKEDEEVNINMGDFKI